jgi:hypothetical protein
VPTTRRPITDRLLLGPGPSNPYPEATAALARPLLGHMDPEFLAILDETMARLRTVFRTENALTLPISGTGSAGMEACFVNLLETGDVAIVGANGVFGDRMCEVARRCGVKTSDLTLIELTSAQATILAPRLPELRALGLDCQPFGGSAFLIRAVPHVTGASASPASFVEALAQEAAEEGDDWLGAVCVSLACR